MKLYLAQHGDAVSKEIDPDRPLSDGGRYDVEKLATFLSPLGLSVSRIVHSGKARARQTAELLAAAFITTGTVEVVSGINPNDPPSNFTTNLERQTGDLLVVGHLPFLARLASLLVTGSDQTAIVSFQPGSLLCLQRNDSSIWVVTWMLRPKLLAKI